MDSKESVNIEKFTNKEQYLELFHEYHLLLVGMDNNRGCYRFTVRATDERKDALTYKELSELCARLSAVCIDVQLEGEKDFDWCVFYTTVI